jgi:CRISPR system Cascade subunit CasC
MLIQIHILQSYAPSNLNRDENNSPKTATFGGYRRGRISSQCQKRVVRVSDIFKEAFENDGWLAQSTKDLPLLVQEELEQMKVDPQPIRDIVARLHELGKSDKKDRASAATTPDGEDADENKQPKGKKTTSKEQTPSDEKLKTKQLIRLAANEPRSFAEKVLKVYQKLGATRWNDTSSKNKLTIDDITKELVALGVSLPRSVDIALFGRMTTNDAFEDVEASTQVAHALSTHKMDIETDFFTAFDDHANQTAHLGDTEFNACVYYRYFNLHWDGLLKNLQLAKQPTDDELAVARKAALTLLEAAAWVQPTGKRNGFAHNQLPDLVLVERYTKNLPVSYANAFLKPARENDETSLMDDSVNKLRDYMARLQRAYNLDGERAFFSVPDYTLPHAERKESLAAVKQWLEEQLLKAQ